MATTKVIKDLTELNPGDPDYVLNSTNAVTVSSASGSNKYYFNGVYDGKFGLRKGTTVLTGVPVAHPIAVLNDGLTGITYTGTFFNTLDVGGVTYNFYTGDVTITVTADFGVASYYCYYHQYMGGENNLVSVYSTAGLKMPKGSSAYAAPPTVAQGMMRNLGGTASEGSVSVMQHYNGTEWKNFVNINPTPPLVVDFLVIAGGGGGAGGNGYFHGGGGGAGGYRNSYLTEPSGGNTTSESSLSLNTSTSYTVTVGEGGGPRSGGLNSVFSTITSAAAHYGGTGGYETGGSRNGQAGGSGGGACYSGSAGGAVSPTQGYSGGGAPSGSPYTAGGGGGAGVAGYPGTSTSGGNGGNGLASLITGTSVTRAGGGGGTGSGITDGLGGLGGGGNGGYNSATSGTTNTGSGGGGSDRNPGNPGSGGSGVVILRYPKAYTITAGGSLTSSTITDGTDKVTTFTAGSDTITFS